MISTSGSKKEIIDFSEKYLTEKNLTRLICGMILGFPVLELICVPFNAPFLLQELFLKLCGYILLLFFLFRYIASAKHRLCLSDLLLISSAIFAVISIVTSLDISQSLHGRPNYSETPLQTLGYFMGFFACSQIEKTENKKKIMYAFAGMFIMEMIVGTLQKMQVWPWKDIWGTSRIGSLELSFGLTENSNFYGTLCVLAVGFFMCQYASDISRPNSEKQSVCAYLLSVWAFICALFSGARLAWVGIAGAVIAVIFLDSYLKAKASLAAADSKKKKILLISYLLIFILFSLFDPVISSRFGSVRKDILTLLGLASGDMDTSAVNALGTKRGYLWRVCIKAWLKRPILGLGFDNLRYAFTIFSDPEMNDYIQDKAHNEYLHYLTTQGLFSCLNYLFLCGYVIKKGVSDALKKFKRSLETGEREAWLIQFMLLTMIFGYFCQAFFSSSVTNIAVYKWLIMGLLLDRSEQKNLLENRR